ncbi:MAG: hypothetical protein AMS24_03675 [Chlamydiae bacterium SM23_39]|nr:MAG: hypothetical protein AMS24_03675 [Chlamydiae bacterium SM23_39]
MYDYLTGILKEKKTNKIVLDVNGIGYTIFIPINFYNNLLEIDSHIKCFTFLVIKEDSHTLYGFSSKEERDLFEIMLSISGIGPKMALSLIGHLESNLQKAIYDKDINIISKVPGIGKKKAERLIIDLKDKLKTVDLSFKKEKNHIFDAVSALVNLGYNPIKAQKAIQKAIEENRDEKDVGKLISFALKNIPS